MAAFTKDCNVVRVGEYVLADSNICLQDWWSGLFVWNRLLRSENGIRIHLEGYDFVVVCRLMGIETSIRVRQ